MVTRKQFDVTGAIKEVYSMLRTSMPLNKGILYDRSEEKRLLAVSPELYQLAQIEAALSNGHYSTLQVSSGSRARNCTHEVHTYPILDILYPLTYGGMCVGMHA